MRWASGAIDDGRDWGKSLQLGIVDPAMVLMESMIEQIGSIKPLRKVCVIHVEHDLHEMRVRNRSDAAPWRER
jgi:hypothetical protein